MVIIKKLERYKNDNYAQVTQGGEERGELRFKNRVTGIR